MSIDAISKRISLPSKINPSNKEDKKAYKEKLETDCKFVGMAVGAGSSVIKNAKKIHTFSNIDKYKEYLQKGKHFLAKKDWAKLGEKEIKATMWLRKRMAVAWTPISIVATTVVMAAVGKFVGKLLGTSINLKKDSSNEKATSSNEKSLDISVANKNSESVKKADVDITANDFAPKPDQADKIDYEKVLSDGYKDLEKAKEELKKLESGNLSPKQDETDAKTAEKSDNAPKGNIEEEKEIKN